MRQKLANDMVSTHNIDLQRELQLLRCGIEKCAATNDAGEVELRKREVSAIGSRSGSGSRTRMVGCPIYGIRSISAPFHRAEGIKTHLGADLLSSFGDGSTAGNIACVVFGVTCMRSKFG